MLRGFEIIASRGAYVNRFCLPRQHARGRLAQALAGTCWRQPKQARCKEEARVRMHPGFSWGEKRACRYQALAGRLDRPSVLGCAVAHNDASTVFRAGQTLFQPDRVLGQR